LCACILRADEVFDTDMEGDGEQFDELEEAAAEEGEGEGQGALLADAARPPSGALEEGATTPSGKPGAKPAQPVRDAGSAGEAKAEGPPAAASPGKAGAGGAGEDEQAGQVAGEGPAEGEAGQAAASTRAKRRHAIQWAPQPAEAPKPGPGSFNKLTARTG
jgi:hypothetical protein